jgi:hypothetical protein
MAEIATLDSSLPTRQAGVDTHEYGKKIRLQQDFEEQLELRARNRHELGRIARELKRHYLFSGGGNGWTAYITRQGLEVRTVDRWIENFEIKEGIRPDKVVGQNVRSFSDTKDLRFERSADEPAAPLHGSKTETDPVDAVADSAETSNVQALKQITPAQTASACPKKSPRRKPQVYELDDHRKSTRAIAASQVKAYFMPFQKDQTLLRGELKAFFQEVADALVTGLAVELKESE